ncbi:hypothetical protein GCM10022383_07850 [Microbacterium soli]|uniref:Uncharacterized protein n=1 Tax=Microbacterium soli TaxID=446075 RepID=A0ABP7MYN6_9MICO
MSSFTSKSRPGPGRERAVPVRDPPRRGARGTVGVMMRCSSGNVRPAASVLGGGERLPPGEAYFAAFSSASAKSFRKVVYVWMPSLRYVSVGM